MFALRSKQSAALDAALPITPRRSSRTRVRLIRAHPSEFTVSKAADAEILIDEIGPVDDDLYGRSRASVCARVVPRNAGTISNRL